MTSLDHSEETRLNVRLSGPLADHVNRQVDSALYSTHSEYIRDLIRRDMAADSDEEKLRRHVIEAYGQLGAGNFRRLPARELFNKALDELRAEGMAIGDEEYK